MDQRLRPIERLQTSGQFRRVFREGRFFSTPALAVHFRRSAREYSRLGLVVSRRRGKAHVRNRIKRHLRQLFREQKQALPRVYDIVIIPRGEPREGPVYHASFREFVAFIRRGGKGARSRRPERGRRRPKPRSEQNRNKIRPKEARREA